MKKAVTPLLIILALALPLPSKAQPPAIGGVSGCPTVDRWGNPSALRVAAVPQGLRVSWLPSPEAPTEAEGFEIIRSRGVNGPWIFLGLVPNTVTEYIDSTAVPGEIYFYRVRALSGGTCSPFSDPARGIK